ncbi:MAG: nucleoside monophosphate kinase [Candidatus Didemnitutus sp.]|jgi:adenylate kinase|nr:nucleoside monophosphate kinase [Candidatus Didemnitutus sp.]
MSSPVPPAAPKAPPPHDLEIKDAAVIFEPIWADLEEDYGRENLRFPKELILLGGAPGAGKGTNTPYISKARGLTCQPIVMSALLDTPEMKRLKEAGSLIGDREVLSVLLRQLLKPEYRDGVILDGFPRTKVQVDCLKMLYEKMVQLWREFYGTPLGIHFRQPVVHIVVLFVDEKESIARQLKRGRESKAHNEEVRVSGRGELLEERATDFDEALAARRYRVFKEQTWDALLSLKDIFHYHLINAQGAINEVEGNIAQELAYQSSLELDPRTYDQLRSLPLASEIVIHARQELVKRLDGYALNHPELFARVIGLIDKKILPIVLRHAISGHAHVNSEDPLLDEPGALAMLIDIFSERGYHAVVDVIRLDVPDRFDLQTGKISCRQKKVNRIMIRFRGSELRRG